MHNAARCDERTMRKTGDLVALEIRHHAARLAHEQHTGRDVPRREAQLPEAIERSVRDRGEIEGSRAGATNAGSRADYRRELSLVSLEVHRDA